MIKNICHNCKNHDICMCYRYNGVLPPKVEAYTIDNGIFFIEKCSAFSLRAGLCRRLGYKEGTELVK